MTHIDYTSWEYDQLLDEARRFELVLRRDLREDQVEVMAELEEVKTELSRRKPGDQWKVDYDEMLRDL
jgi:hypothetical protein